MKHIKKYENFQVNEEFGIVEAFLGIALTSFIVGTLDYGLQKANQLYDTYTFNSRFYGEKVITVYSKFVVDDIDYKTPTEAQTGSTGLKWFWETIKRRLGGTKIKKEVNEEYQFLEVKDQKDDRPSAGFRYYYAIQLKVTKVEKKRNGVDREYTEKKILVFDNEQFLNFKTECEKGTNPMKKLKETGWKKDVLEIYTPLQW